MKAVAESVKDSTICGLARALDKDIDRAGEALKNANSGRIHTFIATSPIHMQHKLRMSPDQVVEQAVHAVRRARQYTDNVEFSAEDAGRSEIDFLCRIFEAVIDAGAVRFRPMMLTAAAVVVGASVILFDPIFQGLAISLMAGEVASLLFSRMTVPILYYMDKRWEFAHGHELAVKGDVEKRAGAA